jgi:ABC-type transport system involved in multi-copper enzyme maturation permease subunit
LSQDGDRTFGVFWRSVREVFSFFLFFGKKARRTRVFFLIGFLPVVMAMVFKFDQVFSHKTYIDELYIFSNIIMTFYLQFLILILALFYGTSVCSEEIEGKTLTYLVTRPVSKSAVILGKYFAYILLVILMVVVGMIFSFLILNTSHLLDFSAYRLLLRYLGVLSLGLVSYTAFFTLFGTFLKRSILFGLLFGFGWENVIQYFPGSTQRFAIVHYLKSLLPGSTGGRFSFLMFRLEPTSPGIAIVMLFLMTAVFLGIACLVFTLKEYIFED